MSAPATLDGELRVVLDGAPIAHVATLLPTALPTLSRRGQERARGTW